MKFNLLPVATLGLLFMASSATAQMHDRVRVTAPQHNQQQVQDQLRHLRDMQNQQSFGRLGDSGGMHHFVSSGGSGAKPSDKKAPPTLVGRIPVQPPSRIDNDNIRQITRDDAVERFSSRRETPYNVLEGEGRSGISPDHRNPHVQVGDLRPAENDRRLGSPGGKSLSDKIHDAVISEHKKRQVSERYRDQRRPVRRFEANHDRLDRALDKRPVQDRGVPPTTRAVKSVTPVQDRDVRPVRRGGGGGGSLGGGNFGSGERYNDNLNERIREINERNRLRQGGVNIAPSRY